MFSCGILRMWLCIVYSWQWVTGLNTRLALYCCAMMDDVTVLQRRPILWNILVTILLRRDHFVEYSRYDPTAKGPLCGIFSLGSYCAGTILRNVLFTILPRRSILCNLITIVLRRIHFFGMFSLRSYCAGTILWNVLVAFLPRRPILCNTLLTILLHRSILLTALVTILLRRSILGNTLVTILMRRSILCNTLVTILPRMPFLC